MNILKSLKKQFNNYFIKNNVLIVGEMQQYYKTYGRPENSVKRAKLALWLYTKYGVLKKNPISIKQKKVEGQIYPESSESRQISEWDLQQCIEKADVVVFDIWNVLIYSALDARQILVLLETMVKCPGISEHVDFNSVIDKEHRRCLEEISVDFCLDNEYMHDVWNRAKTMGKSVYLYNNSDVNDIFTKKIIEKFAYCGEIYRGDPYQELYITAGPKKKRTVSYRNVNELGEYYRPFYYKNVVTALYNQIINLKLHAGQSGRTIFYEYGFTCGGILTCGFCQFLNELAEREKVDKFLFVARDGDIIKKVYDQYYKKHDTSYLIYSRFASYEIIFEDFPEEYIEKNIRKRMMSHSKDHTIGKILYECGLECLEEYLEEHGFSYKEELNDKNYVRFKQFLLCYKERIVKEFHNSSVAAKQYFLQEIQGYSRICVVDLGWRGTSTVYLKHLFETKYKWNGNVIGAVIGAALDDVTQTYIRNGMLYAYAFDNEFYRRTGAGNGEYMSQEETFCFEALFSAEESTLLRYTLDVDGNVDFIYGPQNKNRDNTIEIQKGIMDYAKECAPLLNKYCLRILSRDAYTPLDSCMQNRQYREMIYQAYEEESDAINGF